MFVGRNVAELAMQPALLYQSTHYTAGGKVDDVIWTYDRPIPRDRCDRRPRCVVEGQRRHQGRGRLEAVTEHYGADSSGRRPRRCRQPGCPPHDHWEFGNLGCSREDLLDQRQATNPAFGLAGIVEAGVGHATRYCGHIGEVLERPDRVRGVEIECQLPAGEVAGEAVAAGTRSGHR